MSTVLVVTEAPLGPTDLENIATLAPSRREDPEERGTSIRLLVSAETDRKPWLEFLDQLALLDFEEAYKVASHAQKGPLSLESQAEKVLEDSLKTLEDAGYEATGRTAVGDPLEAVRAETAESDASQVLIITDPRPVEDSLNIGWAHRAEETLGVPVLHVYWGTGYIDD